MTVTDDIFTTVTLQWENNVSGKNTADLNVLNRPQFACVIYANVHKATKEKPLTIRPTSGKLTPPHKDAFSHMEIKVVGLFLTHATMFKLTKELN